MVSLEKIRTTPKSPEHNSSPRLSFSADFLDDKDFISINPTPPTKLEYENTDKGKYRAMDFEFLSNKNATTQRMITADELFFEGKMLPFRQFQHVEKLSKISIKKNDAQNIEEKVFKKHNIVAINNNNNNRVNWFIDDDPSPRPPSCTVLWKELLKLKKKQHDASSLSPSSSSSSSSSTALSVDQKLTEEKKKKLEKKEKQSKITKKGLEKAKSGSLRIRSMVNVPVCAQGKSNGLAHLFSFKKVILER